MKFSRITLAAALSAGLVLTACSDEDPAASPSGEPAVTTDDAAATEDAAVTDGAATTGDAADSTADPAASTAGADEDDTVAMSTDGATAAISLEEAEEVAETVLTRRAQADQGDGEDIVDHQRMSMMGSARQAHVAADQLEPVFGAPEEVDLEENPVEPNVLAISRDDGELPLFILVQTVPANGLPVLHLLESRTGENQHFRIIWEAPMRPGTEVPSFDRRSQGTPVLRSGQGDLLTEPGEMLKSFASYTSYPAPEEVPHFRTHGYSPEVRRAAQEQADQVSGLASLRERNWVVSEDIKTLRFEDGSAFVMGTLLRDTHFDVNSDSELNPPESFRVFQDSAVLTDEATMRTLVFLGLRAPAEDADFPPEVIAVREQMVDAWGS